MTPTVNLSRAEIRKLALVNQGLNRSDMPRGLKGVQQVVSQLGYVQIDTISVVERAHHHTLWNRVPHYRRHYIDRLMADREIFEYWAHAAALLPIRDYRFCLPRMRALAAGQRHWYRREPKLMRRILDQVRSEGPLQARDFEDHQGVTGMWEWGPVKQAIEQLFMEGELMVTRRENFQKIFDLTERVLPGHVDTTCPDEVELAGFLIDRFVASHGLGRKTEFGYLQRGMGEVLQQALDQKLEQGQLVPVSGSGLGDGYYANCNYIQVLDGRLRRQRVRLLSPFDNLVIQRERSLRLFGFDYQLECYVPAAKRKHGYFCMPILWQDKLVGRMDAKADRKSGRFIIQSMSLDQTPAQYDAFLLALARETRDYAGFCQCGEIDASRIRPRVLGQALAAALI